jgi:hypothetical protein
VNGRELILLLPSSFDRFLHVLWADLSFYNIFLSLLLQYVEIVHGRHHELLEDDRIAHSKDRETEAVLQA